MNILYLCTGNSCRSQMAEGWTRHLGGDAIAVHCLGASVDGERLPLPVQTVPLRAPQEADLGKPRALCSDGGCVYVGCTR